ncbi:MAG: RagB/SusD family nutrient uptake outer membrane protein, partial [Ginsengibacter sp.]
MKKYTKFILCIISIALLSSSCKKYLDKAPESGLSEEKVFSKYQNTKAFFDVVYLAAGVFRSSGLGASFMGSLDLDNMCDFADGGRVMWNIYHKWGPLGDNVGPHFYNQILIPAFKNIRVSNKVLENIGMLKDGDPEDIDDLVAQAHFVRAFEHFELFRLWGAMPYITKV